MRNRTPKTDTIYVGSPTVKSDCSILERIVFSGTILLAIAILYGPSVYYGYLADDFHLVKFTLSDVINESFNGLHVRPVWYLSYYLTNLFVHSSVLDHSINLLLFLVACVLGFRVASNFLGQERKAFIVTAIWIVLPWNSFSIMWISERNDLLVAVFTFFALLSLHHGNYTKSLVSMILAVFSKVTAMFLPLFFAIKTYRLRRYIYTIMFTGVMIGYVILAGRAMVINFSALGSQEHWHTLQIGLISRLFIWGFNYFEALIIQFLPIPYFLNWWFLALYLLGVIGVGFFACFDVRKVNRDAIILVLLCTAPGFMAPNMRILGLPSFFIIVAIISSYEGLKNKTGFVVCTAMIVIFFCLGVFISRPSFNTGVYDLTQITDWKNRSHGYLNNYYEVRRNWLIYFYKVVFHSSKKNSCIF